jgi:hypothetical protein
VCAKKTKQSNDVNHNTSKIQKHTVVPDSVRQLLSQVRVVGDRIHVAFVHDCEPLRIAEVSFPEIIVQYIAPLYFHKYFVPVPDIEKNVVPRFVRRVVSHLQFRHFPHRCQAPDLLRDVSEVFHMEAKARRYQKIEHV